MFEKNFRLNFLNIKIVQLIQNATKYLLAHFQLQAYFSTK